MPDVVLLEAASDALRRARDAGRELYMRAWAKAEPTRCRCLAGWIAEDPIFRGLGLIVLEPDQAQCRTGMLNFRDLQGFDALCSLFEIDMVQCDYLFSDNPAQTGFDAVKTFDEGIARIWEVIRGEV
jgi:hypothetical protein